MSGGHFNYAQSQVRDALEQVARDEELLRRFPRLAELFGGLAVCLYDLGYELDYDFSGDSHIDDDAAFESAALGAVLHAVLRVAPDEWFPRGKWATIQAFQERSGYAPHPEDV